MQNYLKEGAFRQFLEENLVAITVIVVTGVVLLSLRRWFAGGVCRSRARLDGKTVIVTGADSGIGKEAALDMARRGIYSSPKLQTEDGFELHFGVNHLGHFLLTNCLLDMLKRSAPSRIVNVSSLAHEKGKIDFDDINQEKDYNPYNCYKQSKLANVLFTRELANRLEACLQIVFTKMIYHRWSMLPLWKRFVGRPVLHLLKSPWQGAQTIIYCAVDESLEGVSGLYYSDCAPKEAAPQGRDDAAAKRLWYLSASMVGLE